MKILAKLLIFFLIVLLIVVGVAFASVYFTLGREHEQYIPLIEKYSKEIDIDEDLLAAIIKVESNFDKNAKSNMDARGLMQLLPETAEWMSEHEGIEYSEEDLMDPEKNIKLGSHYFKYLFDMYKSEDLAILAYNGGMGNVNKWLETGLITNDQSSYANVPIYETKSYLGRIKDNRDFFRLMWDDVFKDTKSSQFHRTLKFIKILVKNYL